MFSNSQEVYTYLSSFINLERKLEPVEYRLDRMQYLRRLFNFPDEACKIIHVTGSKGKGSTSTMIASVLQSAGYITGLFTSPHLLSFTERICINMLPVSDEILLPCAELLQTTIPEGKPLPVASYEYPTFFELLTILAFLCFKKAGCEYAVVEVGLGGRLDTTNVVTPELCVITSIELEHTEILGDSIEKIAFEKAGIIKSLTPVVSSVKKPEARAVIYDKAYESCAKFIEPHNKCLILDTCDNKNGLSVAWMDAIDTYSVHTSLHGKSQVANILSAFYACEELGVATDAILEGISKTILQARFQVFDGSPTVILDGAHTEDSIANTVDTYKTLFATPCVMLFGTAIDKHSGAMLQSLAPLCTTVVITKPGTFKQSDPERTLHEAEACGLSCIKLDDTHEAFYHARQLAKQKGIPMLVCGSFYLCAEVLALLSQEPCASEETAEEKPGQDR